MALSKKINNQIRNKFDKMKAFGDSKHQLLEQGRKEGDQYKYTQDKIFSFKTYQTYKTNTEIAFDKIQEMHPNKNFKDINQFEKYVPEYLEKCISEGKSAWTVQAYASALSKFYGKSNPDWKVELPERKRDEITRTRNTREDQRFSEKLNPEVVRWAKNTGLRRSELENIKKSDCRLENGKLYIDVKGSYAKGGKPRTVECIAEGKDLDKMIERLENLGDKNRVFGAIKAQAPIHKYRAEYARNLYEREARPREQITNKKELYTLRGGVRAGETYDRVAMRTVTENLGHGRLNVIADHYLQGGY